MSREITDAIKKTLVESPPFSEQGNVADGLFAIARSLDGVAKALRELGNNECGLPGEAQMGAIEMLALEVRNGFQGLSEAVVTVADEAGGKS